MANTSNPVQPARVLIVRGRTQTEVFHTNPHCPKLRVRARPVARRYAEDACGYRQCGLCESNPNALLCCEGPGTPCSLGRVPTVETRPRQRLYEQRQTHLFPRSRPPLEAV
jgi:hypothetical protein